MIRFMGFVTGAAVAIAAMLFVFGLPEVPDAAPAELPEALEAAAGDAGAPGADAADSRSPEPNTTAEPAAPTEPLTANPQPATPATDTPEPLVESVPAEPPRAAAGTPLPTDDIAADGPAAAPIAVADDAPGRDLRWHAFWSPFASRIAADGFVSRLEAVTGFDYRVVKIDNGVYEVAFGYASDDERLTKLAAIEAATGLEMPDS